MLLASRIWHFTPLESNLLFTCFLIRWSIHWFLYYLLLVSFSQYTHLLRNDEIFLGIYACLQEDPNYAPGVQKKISGEVIRWHNENGSESMDASVYVELLENEITQLQEQLERSKKVANGGNELLNYLKTLEPQNLQVRCVLSTLYSIPFS